MVSTPSVTVFRSVAVVEAGSLWLFASSVVDVYKRQGQSPDYSQAETFESQFDPSAQEAFQAFFRFPFAPDTRWKVTVTKDQDGLLTQLALSLIHIFYGNQWH